MEEWRKYTDKEKDYREALLLISECRSRMGSRLDLSVLGLKKIPPHIEHLPQLRSLNLYMNNISSLAPLSKLDNLDELLLGSNDVSDLEPISNLTRLTSLDLDSNDITSLSALSNLTKLKKLDIQMTKVHSLRPIANLLKAGIPLTFESGHVKKAIYLNALNCPLKDPPKEIARLGNKAILKYWKEQDRLGTQLAYEGRLIIVGEGKVGKTTLLNKLKDPDYKLEKLDQTHGINIWRDWKFSVPNTEVEYSASVWDFGGQDIQHLTHQYFFTPGTVFLLVVNKRGSNAADEARQLNYWFRIIELMGRYDGQKARILVVHNVFNGDKSSQGINLGPYQEKYKDTLEITFKEVNLAEKSGTFDDLRGEIQEALIKLPGVGENIIAGWPDIRRKIRERREERRISFREFGKICGEHDIIAEDSQLLLSRYLARLGELLHYEHGGLLFDNVLLDIDWITTAVYGITENKDFIDRNGRFTREEIIGVWVGNGVTNRSDHELMLQLLQMDAFELCWQTDAGDYLTPTLFSTKMPEKAPSVKTDLGLRFHYDYLPMGLLGQLIVRLHKHLEANHYWKDGIFLSREGCRAKISRPLVDQHGERIIEILVTGEAPRNYALLTWITEQLETIHRRSFPRIKFEREIPCPCPRCLAGKLGQHYFPVTKLRDLQREGDINVTCANNRQTQINRLLEGMHQLEKQSPMSFAQDIRNLVANNKLAEALALLDRQYPSDATAALSGEYKQLQSNKIMGILNGGEERQVNAQISARLLQLATSLSQQSTEEQQRRTLEEQLPEIRSQLDRIEDIGKDTNNKVTALGKILLHVGKEVEDMRGDLFESRQEERRFMRKLEETVEQLPALDQPKEEWYDMEAKEKIKLAFNLPILPGIISAKWEKEMDTSAMRMPGSWQEVKQWFVRD